MTLTRHSLRLRNYDYSQAGAYFVTVCTHARVCLFGKIADGEMRLNALGEVVAQCWAAIPEHFPDVELDAYCVMPNHIHGIVVITHPAGATHASPLPNDRLPARPHVRWARSSGHSNLPPPNASVKYSARPILWSGSEIIMNA